MDSASTPLFQQVADLVADTIVDGSLAEGERAPSTNELAAFHAINPATARNGLNVLAEAGVLRKQRGIGMFVAMGARERILTQRRAAFAADYLVPLVDEAAKLDMTLGELGSVLHKVAQSRGLYPD